MGAHQRPHRPDENGWDARLFGVLTAAALFGSAAVFPYALQVSGTPVRALQAPLAVVWAASTLQATLLAGVAAFVGLRLGPRVGLGAPLISDAVHRRPVAEGRLMRVLGPAVLIGAAVGGLILVLDASVFSVALEGRVDQIPRPDPVLGLLASFYGGIVEELLLRFGLMTFLVWLLQRTFGGKEVSAGQMWIGIVLAAVVFGLGHLPLTAAAVPLTSGLVARALVLNGVPGVVFGWLYWRQGLLAAMASHFAADVVLHFLFPLLMM